MDNNFSFEETLLELDSYVKALESGSMSLEESIAKFENAVKLVRICNKKLNDYERKVKILIENSNGEVSDKPFDIDCNET